jgi:hypothetical protein
MLGARERLDQSFAVAVRNRCPRAPTLRPCTPRSTPLPTSAGRASEIVTRSVAAVGLAGIALIHLLDSLGKLQETPDRAGCTSA